jgi:hypothetical protein
MPLVKTNLRGFLAIVGIGCLLLADAACSHRKDGVIVEISDDLAPYGVAVRDWRRSGEGVLDVQIHTPIAIPPEAWTLAAYDKAGNLLTSGRILGPRARENDTVWIQLQTPYRDLFDRADRVVVGASFSSPPLKPDEPD